MFLFFVFEVCLELLFHPCRPPAIFPWLPVCQGGSFLSLEEAILDKMLKLSYENVEDGGGETEGKQKEFYCFLLRQRVVMLETQVHLLAPADT